MAKYIKKEIKKFEHAVFDFLWRTDFQKKIYGVNRVICLECELKGEINVLGNTFVLNCCSHILNKKSYELLRLNRLNIQPLCYKHHQQWDFGNKKDMIIYEENIKLIYELEKYNNHIYNKLSFPCNTTILQNSGYNDKEVGLILSLAE